VSTLTGTGTLLRFMLRRDRLRLPLWVLGMGLMALYISTALGTVLDEESLPGMAQMAATPVMALIGGPGYGFDAITIPRFFAGLYGAYLMLGAALMSMTTLSRHTRAEEQSGRGELVLADVVGRHAQLTAAQRTAREAGMPVGIVHDLAVGVHPAGADAWAMEARVAADWQRDFDPGEVARRREAIQSRGRSQQG